MIVASLFHKIDYTVKRFCTEFEVGSIGTAPIPVKESCWFP